MLGNHIRIDRQPVDDTKREFLINSIASYIESVNVLAKLYRADKVVKLIIEEVSDDRP